VVAEDEAQWPASPDHADGPFNARAATSTS
jgi:hypothetical protein